MMTEQPIENRNWGGARRGAGRKKSRFQNDAPHRTRPELSSRNPVHAVLRTMPYVDRLRQPTPYGAIRTVLLDFVEPSDFRVIHVSIQANHIHLLIEATDKQALGHGMRSLTIKLAFALQEAMGVRGKVFRRRYHATHITTPRQARNALAYVLNNWRKHGEDMANARTMAARLDPYASGLSFDGWIGAPRFAIPDGYLPLPVSAPTTDLLASAWKRFGAIDPFECPGPLR